MVIHSRQAHIAVIIQNRFIREVDFIVGELLDNAAQSFCLRQVVHHLAQVELIDNVLHVAAEAVQVVAEVHLQAQRVRFALQGLHRELRRVIKRIARDIIQYRVLVLNIIVIQHLLLRQYLVFRGLKQHIDASQNHHRHNDFLILAFLEGVNQHICRYIPDEREQLIILTLVHIFQKFSSIYFFNST